MRHWFCSGSTFELAIGYSRAVVDGDWVFVSGTTGFDYVTMTIASDVIAQCEQCLKNIETALVETGSRMDDVIFEEFKGTGNCEIKLDRSLAERRIYPAIDIPASGTRREDKLFRPDQLDAVYVLRRGLQQMPASAAMEWLIKRIGNTPSNDHLLATLREA